MILKQRIFGFGPLGHNLMTRKEVIILPDRAVTSWLGALPPSPEHSYEMNIALAHEASQSSGFFITLIFFRTQSVFTYHAPEPDCGEVASQEPSISIHPSIHPGCACQRIERRTYLRDSGW